MISILIDKCLRVLPPIGCLALVVLTTCGRDSPTKPVPPEPPPPVVPVATRIEITPSSATLTAIGQTIKLTVRVFDQNNIAMTGALVSWSSGSMSIATVSAQGLVTAAGPGSVEITASAGAISGKATVSVMQRIHTITLSPSTASLTVGDTLRISAVAADINANIIPVVELEWTSSNGSIAGVDTTGLVQAHLPGTAVISAASGGVRGQAVVTVTPATSVPTTISVTPTRTNLTWIGQTVQLAAVVRDQRGRPVPDVDVSWISSDASVATVSAQGLVTAAGPGSVEITASAGAISGKATVSVMQRIHTITLSPSMASLTVGDTLRISAEAADSNGNILRGVELGWMSSNPDVARVDATGLVTAKAEGNAEITASSGGVIGSAVVTVTSHQDRAALEAFYHATNGPNWTNSTGWLTNAPLEAWHGVSTDENGRVRSLRLFANNLSGTIPTELSSLQGLISLELFDNNLTGSIPPELGDLRALSHVSLSNNDLSGPIPPEFGRLMALEFLSIYGNRLNGPIPSELGALHNLKETRLSNNELSGTIPADLGNLPGLEVLDLYENKITGPIPPELGSAANLRELGLSRNRLSGFLPPELGNLQQLEHLTIARNNLSGEIPIDIFRLRNLKTLRLDSNRLSGPIPSEIGNLASLRHLELAGNNLSGSVPGSIGNLTELKIMFSGNNSLTGPIPPELGTLTNLQKLSLILNKLTGPIPPELGNLINLEELDLSYNSLSGTIPIELVRLNLEYLGLEHSGVCAPYNSEFQTWLRGIERKSASNCGDPQRDLLIAFYHAANGPDWSNSENWLTDKLLNEWYGVTLDSEGRITQLSLGGNNLSGAILPELGDLKRLKGLVLRDNNLSGLLPPELGRLNQLRVLDLGSNDLRGTISSKLGDLKLLEVLDFSDNPLTGPIPRSFSRLDRLRSLRLDDTRLCAPLDADFRSWLQGIKNIDVSDCDNRDRESLIALYNATDGPAWNNQGGWLSGDSIGEWHGVTADARGLVTGLDLSDNNLSGQLPPEIGNLTSLSVLDLGSNDLSGQLPLEMGRLSINALRLGGTKLCAPIDEEFLGWLRGIADSDVAHCEIGDKETLVTIYNALNGSNWTNNTGWLSDAPLNEWHGVETDGLGRVTGLSLPDNNLSGVIPPEIGDLLSLRTLNLLNNFLYNSTIPSELGNLLHLRDLDLRGTGLKGAIPPELGNLQSLTSFKLASYRLTGPIPPELGNLVNLTTFDIESSRLTGPIPPELGNLVNLTILSIRDGTLSGPIPPELGNLERLVELRLDLNNLTGPIPLELAELTGLTVLDLGSNGLTGTIPDGFGELHELEQLNLEHNEISGPIPPDLGNLVSLTNMRLENNSLEGPIPPELGNLIRLEELRLDHNQLIGAVPAELGKLKRLFHLYLNHNHLDGVVPSALSNLESLQTLRLDETDLCILTNDGFSTWLSGIETTSLPPDCVFPDRDALTNLYYSMGGPDWTIKTGWATGAPLSEWYGVTADVAGKVTELDLSDNDMSGTIPPIISVLTSLVSLDLGGNSLSGEVPISLGELVRLERLDLSKNMLAGSIPDELGNLMRLVSLDLSGNELGGRIPGDLSQLARLEILRLEDTQVCASGDAEMQAWLEGISDRQVDPCGMTDRDVLVTFYHALNGKDWSDNSGWLSDDPLDTWHGVATNDSGRVTSLEFYHNQMSGELPRALGDLSELEDLFIQQNDINGTIPNELGNLPKLERLYVLLGSLSGAVPAELGNLSGLKVLNLAGNNLSGAIPVELGNLSGLKVLNLAENNLSGAIPEFLGNLLNLVELVLVDNNLTGAIPEELAFLKNLTLLGLAENDLNGTIPRELSNLSNLKELYIYETNVSGAIPAELGKLISLLTLNLRSNKLSGPIPSELGNLAELRNLRMDDNQLSGKIPSELGNLSEIRNMALFDNPSLDGPLPLSFTGLNELVALQLEGTGLCAPDNPAFQNWQNSVLSQRIPLCRSPLNIHAYLTQAAQSSDYPVPLLAGESALLRVFITNEGEIEVPMPPVRATFYHAGTKVHEEDITGGASILPEETDESQLSFSSNVEVPDVVVKQGLEMVIEVDPDNTIDSFANANRRWPETGRKYIDVLDVPTLDLTIVPMLWVENPDRSMLARTEGLTADDELFRFTRDILPVSELTVEVRDYIWTSVEPILDNGNEILSEVDAIRALDGSAGYYKGILTSGGGIAWVGGTTSASVLRGDVIAHELGHNFSLLHAPCGGPDQVDAFFPYDDGSIGVWGYDFLTGELVSPETAELMSYCGPPDWISDYHFGQAIRFRRTEEPLIAAAGTAATRTILVWGGIDSSGGLVLESAFVVDAGPSVPREPGPYSITGEDADGGTLFSADFEMGKIADAEGGVFTFTFPVDLSWRERLNRIILSGPEGVATQDAEGSNAMALLRDSSTGQVRGFLRDIPIETSGVVSARRVLPEPGLEMTVSRGIPDREDW